MKTTGGTAEALRRAFAAVDPSRRADGGCPEAGEIWDAVRGEVGPERVRGLADHVAACPSCAEDWRLARRGDRDRAVAPIRARTLPGWTSALAAAAAVLLAVALVALFQPAGPGAPVYRDPGAGRLESLVPEDVSHSRDDVVLRWSPVGDGASYRVEVGTLDLSAVASGYELADPEFRVPASALEDLPAGATLVWKVEALLPDGDRIVSDAFLLRIE